MELVELTSPVLGTRSTLVAQGRDAVVVDAGAGVARDARAAADARGLVVHAVLLTHGHADHAWDAAAFGVPVHLHRADAYRLVDPFGTLGPLGHAPGGEGALAQVLRQAGIDPASYRAPEQVVPFGGPAGPEGRSPDEVLTFGTLTVVARHAPGHTEGSTIYLVGDAALTGDVLFSGTIGRTDLPGGDDLVMARTLRDVVVRLPAGTRVLPGHGRATTMAVELHHNPFLNLQA